MCRLFAITASDIRPSVKLDIIDRSLVSMMGENSQTDGWGITDGINVWKGTGAYTLNPYDWVNEVNVNRIVLGHLRKASWGTGKTNKEAHPFMFKDKFVGIHNGKFEGHCIRKNAPLGEPDSDSYQAFRLLSEFEGPLNSRVVGAWLSHFDERSVFAVMMLQKRFLYLARDQVTPLFFCKIGNGLMIMTSRAALLNMKNFLFSRHKLNTGPIGLIPQNRLFMLSYGTVRYVEHELKYQYEPSPFRHWGSGWIGELAGMD